ncbi:MAG: hypothetical protein H6606_06220 [Flavobacteriales bacterium]|nr:hypothetical protein [Flavobacteriales bacterium]
MEKLYLLTVMLLTTFIAFAQNDREDKKVDFYYTKVDSLKHPQFMLLELNPFQVGLANTITFGFGGQVDLMDLKSNLNLRAGYSMVYGSTASENNLSYGPSEIGSYVGNRLETMIGYTFSTTESVKNAQFEIEIRSDTLVASLVPAAHFTTLTAYVGYQSMRHQFPAETILDDGFGFENLVNVGTPVRNNNLILGISRRSHMSLDILTDKYGPLSKDRFMEYSAGVLLNLNSAVGDIYEYDDSLQGAESTQFSREITTEKREEILANFNQLPIGFMAETRYTSRIKSIALISSLRFTMNPGYYSRIMDSLGLTFTIGARLAKVE